MLFIFCVLVAAMAIEGIGTYVSVVGLSSLFSANIVIIVLAVALDAGKLVSVSFLYHHWSRINIILRTYMLLASGILMVITSAGAFAYLSTQFQKAMSDTNQHGVILAALTEEKTRLQSRKQEIDNQIAALPNNVVRGRSQLMKQFAPEVNRINDRLIEIDHKLPELKIESIKKNVEVGPIMYVAEVFDMTPARAAKWIIFTIICVFDPLAVVLLLAANFLIQERALKLDQEKKEKKDIKVALSATGQVDSTPEVSAPPPVEEKMEDCYKCSTQLLLAPGLGPFCPNKACDVFDATSGEEVSFVLSKPPQASELSSMAPSPATIKPSTPEVNITDSQAVHDTVEKNNQPEVNIADSQAAKDTAELPAAPPHRSSLEDVSSIADVSLDNNDAPLATSLQSIYKTA